MLAHKCEVIIQKFFERARAAAAMFAAASTAAPTAERGDCRTASGVDRLRARHVIGRVRGQSESAWQTTNDVRGGHGFALHHAQILLLVKVLESSP